MAARAIVLLFALCTGLAFASAAKAERLVLSVSQPQVLITSNFTGADLVLFGVVEDRTSDSAPYDFAVTVRGPQETFVTWRKSRVLGIYVNTDSRTFVDCPAVLAVATNRPADQIADGAVLRREQIGISRNIFLQRVGSDFADVVPDDPFRLAFLRIKAATASMWRSRTASRCSLRPCSAPPSTFPPAHRSGPMR